MRILVVGAGATGGFYGGRLAEAGRDVTFLVRERRAQQIREHGLEMVTPQGKTTLRPRLISAAELREGKPSFDLVIVAPKAYQLEEAIGDFAPAIGPDTMVLPILNGMRHMDILAERFGAERVLGGTVRLVSTLDLQGRVHQLTALNEMSYGEPSGEMTPRIRAVDAAMQGAGFAAMLQADIMAMLWQKWWILASMGVICVLARGTMGEVAEVPRGSEFVHRVVKECTAIAAVNGYPANERVLAVEIDRMTERGSALTSSMYRDMIKGAPVEVDHILGDLLDRAKNVDTPLLTAAYVQLKVYEAGRIRV